MTTTIYELGYTSNGYRAAYCTWTGGTLSAGAQTDYMPFQNVIDYVPQPPIGCVTEERTNDYVKEYIFSISGNIMTTTCKKMQVSATNTWGNAVTADVSDNVFGALVFGI